MTVSETQGFCVLLFYRNKEHVRKIASGTRIESSVYALENGDTDGFFFKFQLAP